MRVKLAWITPDAEAQIVRMARVSNPASQQAGMGNERLIAYLIRHKHWSPFEMASACFEIETTRDIGRQVLRHRSFSFQEFSQRYADVGGLPTAEVRGARMQDPKNRQNSTPADDAALQEWWVAEQMKLTQYVNGVYAAAIQRGIAKEVARAILPEGLTPSRMYMTGTIRSWLHWIAVRAHPHAQWEHRQIASEVEAILHGQLPAIMRAAATNLEGPTT